MWIAYGEKNRRGDDFSRRRRGLLVGFLLVMALLVARAMHLQIVDRHFLQKQGLLRHVDVVTVSAYRGKVLDRHGEPLAVSTPVQSIWVDPKHFHVENPAQLHQLAELIGMPLENLSQAVDATSGRRFVYLKRRVSPELADKVNALAIPGVFFEREFKRYYPAGEVTAHLLGFTNIDDAGQEGMELAYEKYLRGQPGSKRVIRDGKRQIIGDVESVKVPVPGKDLVLSIDQRLQYLAYRELKLAVKKHQASAAAMVVLDAKTGEVLAVVNQPSFNPNTNRHLTSDVMRNRALTDVFEPGSTVKPFVIAYALDAGYITPEFSIDTSPGSIKIGRHIVKDVHNYGRLDLTGILKKSSNVAVSQIALMMPPESFWRFYHQLGFGTSPGTGFPGEASGSLLDYRRWHVVEQATLSYGYGLSASVLQLARAYTALADDGVLHSVSLLQRRQDPSPRRVMTPATARRVRAMLEQVVQKDGTAYGARVEGYRVAGKTGTIKKLQAGGGYTQNRYMSAFVGMAPASDPRLVIAVIVDEPNAGVYYGGLVAAPVFAQVMAGALRVLNVPPDQREAMPILAPPPPLLASSEEGGGDVP